MRFQIVFQYSFCSLCLLNKPVKIVKPKGTMFRPPTIFKEFNVIPKKENQ